MTTTLRASARDSLRANARESDLRANARESDPRESPLPTDTLHALRERRFYPYLFESLARDVTLTVLDLQPGERVLEIGLARGELFLKLATLVGAQGHAMGVDEDAGALDLARARLREVGFAHFEVVEGARGALPFEAESFDAAYASYLLGEADDETCKRVLADLRRVLRPGGRAAICGLTFGERALPRAMARGHALVRKLLPGSAGGLARRSQGLAVEAGFDVDRRLYIEQRGVPSEVLLLRRREALGIRS